MKRIICICGAVMILFFGGCARETDGVETANYNISETATEFTVDESCMESSLMEDIIATENDSSTEGYYYESDTLENFEEVRLTMKEAYNIALEDAKKWAEDAQAVHIISTDNHDVKKEECGIEGKRNCWGFTFNSKENDSQYHVYVIGGAAMFGKESAINVYEEYDMNLIIDSSEAYSVAMKYNISGGVNWAWGYHYILQYEYINNDFDVPVLVLSVRGVDEEGREKLVSLDPYTGELISVYVKTGYDAYGRSIWENIENIGIVTEEETTINEYLSMDRAEFEEFFMIYESSVKYLFDPQEFYDAVVEGLKSGTFSPFSACKSYEDIEEWKEKMTAYYGEGWEERMDEVDVSDSKYWD